MIGLAIIIVLLVLLLPQALFIVPQQNVYIIERLGKFNRTVGAGLNIKIPFFETIAAKVDMRTRQEQFGIDAKTRDNVTVTMAIAAQYRVSAQPAANGQPSGVWRSYYMLANPTAQMRSYLIDALRSSVPQYTLDEVFDKKDAIASDVNQTVSGLMVAYGYDVVSTLITSIDLPADVEQSMNRINSAQREKEAAQSLAEAERIKVVTEARARAEAMEQAGISFDAVVAIEIPDEKIVARMGGRRVCEHCGASYHIVNIPPKTEGVCDVCGGKLVQRKDDDPETVRDRLEVYHRETEPLKGFYEARGILKTVEDQSTVDGTTQAILRALGVDA